MSKILRLNQSTMPWNYLPRGQIHNRIVAFEGYRHESVSHYPIFNAETVFVDACDKNFVYFWIGKYMFPKIKNLYLASHPCEPCFFTRDFDKVYLLNDYSTYKNRWAKNLDHVQLIDSDTYRSLRDKLEPECIII
ncbi:hypothetical protein CE11_00919 [Megavirus courdo11]|uniref:Uncharacterized protein n=4 Tax=Megamimivirinae TaxID=3044648 RepID=A0A2L2DND1_MIMIV|nr:hypothetical protein MegaChil _gp0840 [Megavirus chiliensis]AFX92945.1 hypothetical protein CE11_00919 [Megavirus courdo11]AVG47675.1 hypothetical protein [Acanthamoeba polyphaga mimivirus]AVL94149.1 hypothetical protein mvi_789 [Megavirus vitis]